MKMSKKYSSRATKMVLASLLAASATVPTLASAEVGGTTTRTEATVTSTEVKKETVIDFTLSPADSMVAKYLSKPFTILKTPGGTFLDLNLAESTVKAIAEITVDGKSVKTDRGIYVPYSEDKTEFELSITTSDSSIPSVVTVTLMPDTIREVEVKEEVVEQPTTPAKNPHIQVKDFPVIANGVYDVKYDAYDKDGLDGYTAITRQLPQNIQLEVKDGKYYALISTTEATNAYILGLSIGGKEAEVVSGTAEANTKRVFRVELDSLTEKVDAEVITHRGDVTKPHPYTFGFALEAEDLVLPVPVYVYEDGKANISNMQDYIDSKVLVSADTEGYTIELTFTQGQYVEAFDITGATVAQKSTEDTVKVYTIEVDDISKVYDSTMTITVPQIPGYESKPYTVQIQFGGDVKTPFTDISTSWANSYILDLYSKKIFKYNNQFYPTNNTERYQFALMLQRALKLEVPATSTFTDIEKYDTETKNAIKALSNYGVINGVNTEKTLFAPSGKISRQDTAIMINRLLEKKGFVATEDATTISFVDVKDATNGSAYEKEAYAAITQLNALGIMTGKEGNKFDPKGTLTRAEMAKVLSVTLEVLEGLK